MESSTVSRQYATMLLDSTLENGKWELSKDLVRFLKAIGENRRFYHVISFEHYKCLYGSIHDLRQVYKGEEGSRKSHVKFVFSKKFCLKILKQFYFPFLFYLTNTMRDKAT